MRCNMLLINEKNNNIVDNYLVGYDDMIYFNRKFRELISYCNKNLNKEFIFRNAYSRYLSSTEIPLYYPISTLLLYYIVINYNHDIDKKILSNLNFINNIYNPEDLYSIFHLIKDDEILEQNINEQRLEEHLSMKYKDVAIFRGIFKHFKFRLIDEYNFDGLEHYLLVNQDKSIVPGWMYNNYIMLQDARNNSEVVKKLKLTLNK